MNPFVYGALAAPPLYVADAAMVSLGWPLTVRLGLLAVVLYVMVRHLCPLCKACFTVGGLTGLIVATTTVLVLS